MDSQTVRLPFPLWEVRYTTTRNGMISQRAKNVWWIKILLIVFTSQQQLSVQYDVQQEKPFFSSSESNVFWFAKSSTLAWSEPSILARRVAVKNYQTYLLDASKPQPIPASRWSTESSAGPESDQSWCTRFAHWSMWRRRELTLCPRHMSDMFDRVTPLLQYPLHLLQPTISCATLCKINTTSPRWTLS